MITELLAIFGLTLNDIFNLGSLGAGIFFFSWLFQAWETKKAGKSIVSPAFWIMRLIGVIFLVIYSFQIHSIVFGVTYVITGVITIYNIYMANTPHRTSTREVFKS